MAQGSPKMAQWGGLPLRSAARRAERVGRDRGAREAKRLSPLGKRSIPQPLGPAPPLLPTLATLEKFAHFYKTCAPLSRRLPTLADVANHGLLKGKLRFKQKACVLSVKLVLFVLKFKKKNSKIKLSCESGDDFKKTMVS